MPATKERVCSVCGRPYQNGMGEWYATHEACDWKRVAYVTPEHGFYGCDTGCCGTRTIAYDADDHEIAHSFEFGHPESHEELMEWVRSWLHENGHPDIEIRIDEDELGSILNCPN